MKPLQPAVARPSRTDLQVATGLVALLNAVSDGYLPQPDAPQPFDMDSGDDCRELVRRVLDLLERGSLSRVVWGMAAICDPRNDWIDQHAVLLLPGPGVRLDVRDGSEWMDGLSTRAITVLGRAGIASKAAVRLIGYQGLRCLQGCGQRTADEIWKAVNLAIDINGIEVPMKPAPHGPYRYEPPTARMPALGEIL